MPHRPASSPLLAALLALSLAGCGTSPTTLRARGADGAPAVAGAVRPAPAEGRAPAATVTLRADAAEAARQAPAAPVAVHPAPVGPVAADPASGAPGVADGAARERQLDLFREPYRPHVAYRASTPEDAAVAAALEAEAQADAGAAGGAAPGLGPVTRAWGLIGGALAGAALFGYAVYGGMVGSRDLLLPKRSTFRHSPAVFGWAYQDVRFGGHDGTELVGWYVPAARPTTRALLMLHGHTSNKDRLLESYAAPLHDEFNLFFYDSRYHGESGGKLTTLGWHERRDAAIALDRLRALGNTQVGAMGVSMGGAVAIGLAADRPEVAGVWADCAFSSLHDAVAPRAKLRGYPMPDYVAWSVVRAANLRARHNLPTADPVRAIATLAPRPVFLVHGEADDETTPMNSQKLYDRAQEPRTLWTVPGARHAESITTAPEAYRAKLLTFWRATLPEASLAPVPQPEATETVSPQPEASAAAMAG
ncbi:MAG: alpha/beta hydrolase [Candidatus Sericytochromatia bacterium]|nr:alpha/beta hydrolase [Candidatus Sericytochromatia bacterium]